MLQPSAGRLGCRLGDFYFWASYWPFYFFFFQTQFIPLRSLISHWRDSYCLHGVLSHFPVWLSWRLTALLLYPNLSCFASQTGFKSGLSDLVKCSECIFSSFCIHVSVLLCIVMIGFCEGVPHCGHTRSPRPCLEKHAFFVWYFSKGLHIQEIFYLFSPGPSWMLWILGDTNCTLWLASVNCQLDKRWSNRWTKPLGIRVRDYLGYRLVAGHPQGNYLDHFNGGWKTHPLWVVPFPGLSPRLT